MIERMIPKEAKQAQTVAEEMLGGSIMGIYIFGSSVVSGLKNENDVDVLSRLMSRSL